MCLTNYRAGKVALDGAAGSNLACHQAARAERSVHPHRLTLLAEGKETREINGRQYVLEYPILCRFCPD